MQYTTNLGSSVANVARELAVHMSRPGKENWKSLVRLIGYLKVKQTKGTIIRKPKVIKAVMFCDSNYTTDKETRKSVRGLVDTIGGTLLTCSPKNHRIVMLIITEADYVALSEYSQEVKFVNILREEMTEVQKPSVVYEDNQGEIFLEKNMQVGMCTKHIDICHHFLRYKVEDKDIDIIYIRREENPADIMTENYSKADYVKPMKSIMEGELWV